MKYLGFSVLATLCICVGCDSRSSVAEDTLRQQVETQSHGYMKLASFTKTDGQEMKAFGVEGYKINFEAEIESSENGTWLSGSGYSHVAFNFTTDTHVARPSGLMAFTDVDNPVPVRIGNHFKIKGTMVGEKKESGWHFQQGESHIVKSDSL